MDLTALQSLKEPRVLWGSRRLAVNTGGALRTKFANLANLPYLQVLEGGRESNVKERRHTIGLVD